MVQQQVPCITFTLEDMLLKTTNMTDPWTTQDTLGPYALRGPKSIWGLL